MQCPADAPPWLAWAWHEIGTREAGENRGPAIRRYIALGKCGEEGDPWCAIFVNAALEGCGLRGTRSPSSQSFRYDRNFMRLDGPALGAIVVFWRASRHSGLGHVGFYCGERSGFVWTLGGNEQNMVQIEFLPKAARAFGLEGYYWPKAAKPPEIKRIIVNARIPAHQVSVT